MGRRTRLMTRCGRGEQGRKLDGRAQWNRYGRTLKKWRAATDGEWRAERMRGKWKSDGWMILFEMQDKRGISIQGNGLKSRETE